MRTNIVIDNDLMNQAITLSGLNTKKETVELALQLLIAQKNQGKIKKLKGKLHWEGDLTTMRNDP